MSPEQEQAIAAARARIKAGLAAGAPAPAPAPAVVQPPGNPFREYAETLGKGVVQGANALFGGLGTFSGMAAGIPDAMLDFGNFRFDVPNNATLANIREREGQTNAALKPLSLIPRPPSGEDITGFMHGAMGFEPYKYGNDPWKNAAFTAAEILPSAIATGNVSGVMPALKSVVAPAIGSEAAASIPGVRGSPWEAPARFGGSIAGAGALQTGQNIAKFATTPANPFESLFAKAGQLNTARKAAYAQVDQSGVRIDPAALTDISKQIDDVIFKQHATLPEYLPPDLDRELKNLKAIAARGDALTFTQLDSIYQKLRDAWVKAEPNSSRLAGAASKTFDNWLQGLDATKVVGGGDPAAVQNALTQARQFFGESAQLTGKAQSYNAAFEQALNSLGANYTKAGLQTALRQQFKKIGNKIAVDEDYAATFSPDERDAINALVRGDWTENTLRRIGMWFPTTPAGMVGVSSSGVIPAALAYYLSHGNQETTAGIATLFGIGSATVSGPAKVSAALMQQGKLKNIADTTLNSGVTPAQRAVANALSPGMLAGYGMAANPPQVSNFQRYDEGVRSGRLAPANIKTVQELAEVLKERGLQ